MLILWKARARERRRRVRHARSSRQMEQVLGTCLERGIKIVTNAGGLNPAGLRGRGREIADRLGLTVHVAHVEGDDLIARIDERCAPASARQPRHRRAARRPRRRRSPPTPTSAAGASPTRWPGADVVVCPTRHRRRPRRRPGGVVVRVGARPTGTRWPGRSSPATSSSAGRRPPAATTPSSRRSDRHRARRASRSPRSHADGSIGDHQAPRHRWRRHGRHRHRPAALRDRARELRQPRRDHPLRHDRVWTRRGPTGCGSADTRGEPAPPDHQGLHQLRRRLPQPHDVRAHRASSSEQGGMGRSRAVVQRSGARALRRGRRSFAPCRPPRRADAGAGLAGGCTSS